MMGFALAIVSTGTAFADIAGNGASSGTSVAFSLDRGKEATPGRLEEALSLLRAQRTMPDETQVERAKGILTERIDQVPADARAWTLLAWANMTEHRFGDALAAARTADELAPNEPETLALMTDALVELGRYPEALSSAQRLLDLEPGMRAWVRAARLRFLHNDLEGAIELMGLAAASAGPRGEATAWARLELARLHLQARDLDAAESAAREAELAFPRHIDLLPAKARILAARGDRIGALVLYRQALASQPSAENALAAWRLIGGVRPSQAPWSLGPGGSARRHGDSSPPPRQQHPEPGGGDRDRRGGGASRLPARSGGDPHPARRGGGGHRR